MKKVKNIALMAHVDAGKTTLTEHILYKAGVTRVLGSVDKGTARTDDLTVERQRGISVRATYTSFDWGDAAINLIDTPGHTDFYSQVDRTFLSVDTVIVLVSAVDGVQSGTETVVAEARENSVPVIFFINKCDREYAQKANALAQIKEISKGAFDYNTERYETAAMYNDDIMRAFFDGAPEDVAKTNEIIAEGIRACEVSPILYGSAYTGEGVVELMDFISFFVLSPNIGTPNGEPAGVVFSVTHDKAFGRGAYIRLFAGVLSVRGSVCINGIDEKVTIIKRQDNGRWIDIKELNAGDIALVYGLSGCTTGNTFGRPHFMPPRVIKGLSAKSLLTAQITPLDEAELPALTAALTMMAAEDPLLELVWEPVFGKLHINVMGKIQIEFLSALIEERFGIKVTINEPSVIYKETPVRPSIGFDAYTMPKPCWAVLKFKLTPSERGSGISYKCSAAPNRISYRYRRQVEMAIAPSLKQGLYGWEVTDMDIDLIDGEDHPIHTHPLDFTIATPLALMDGLKNSGTTLLEPILDVKFTFDSKLLGRIMSDITRMRGQAEAPVYRGESVTLAAKLPLASSLDYPVTFASITSGMGIMTQKLHGYRECPLELGKTCPRRGVDPFDRSKYILAARHAMAGSVFDT